MKKITSIAALALSAVMLLGACGATATTTAAPAGETTTAAAAETTTAAAAETTTAAVPAKVETKDMNIQLVSKGFQHDFWQAV